MDIFWEWILCLTVVMRTDQNKVACSTAISTHKGHLRRQAGRQASSQPAIQTARLIGDEDKSASLAHLGPNTESEFIARTHI